MEATSQPPVPKEVKVTILLAGGHNYTIALKSDSPLLMNLLKAVAAQAQPEAAGNAKVFQVPVNEKQQALWFPSNQLVGVVTEPPIFAQPQQSQQQPGATPPAG